MQTLRSKLRGGVALGLLVSVCLLSTPAWAAKPDIPGIVIPDLTPAVVEQMKSSRRLALVIGNAAYLSDPLLKPTQDADSIGKLLSYLGYEVTILHDLSGERMETEVDAFVRRLRDADGALGLVYYSGHGVQPVGNSSYLVPVDFPKMGGVVELRHRAVSVEGLLEKMEADQAGAERDGVNIILMDGCRNNPWVRSLSGKSLGSERPFTPPVGSRSFVGFSTSAGTKAHEGGAQEPHSIFTQRLLRAMLQPGAPLVEVFKAVQDDVRTDTKSIGNTELIQIPDYRDTLGRTHVYFIPPNPDPTTNPQDEAAWALAVKENSMESYTRYLKNYGGGAHAVRASEAILNLIPSPLQAGVASTSLNMPAVMPNESSAFAAGATPVAAPMAASGSPRDQYNSAFSTLRRGDYPAAEVALAAFLKANPNDEMAGNAQYWLGETHYIRGDVLKAAEAFLNVYRTYPKTPMAAASLLKLSIAMGRLGNKTEACTALQHLISEYPQAPDNIKRQAASEQEKLRNCSGSNAPR